MSEQKLLESFLLSVENFVEQVSEESLKASPEGEQQILIRSTGESLVGQTRKLTVFIRETAARLSAAQSVELDRFLQVQDGEAFASRGVEVTKQVLGKGVLGNLIHWISQHLEELKKLLSESLHFILDLLHIPYPDWLDRIFQIIDEFFNLLLSLLADVFGIDFKLTARHLSEQQVNFLREWAAFEMVRVVRSRKLVNQDET